MDYIFMQPPFNIKPFKEMTKKEAKNHFDWYVSEIPNRIEILKEAFQLTAGGKKEELDYSVESLLKLWDWYISRATIEKKSSEELEEESRKLPEWATKDICSQKVSLGWMSIAMDIAIYFAECFIKTFDGINWGLVSKPVRLAYVNKPVLTGFKAGVELDATNTIKNLVLMVANGEKDSEALVKLFKVWVEYV